MMLPKNSSRSTPAQPWRYSSINSLIFLLEHYLKGHSSESNAKALHLPAEACKICKALFHSSSPTCPMAEPSQSASWKSPEVLAGVGGLQRQACMELELKGGEKSIRSANLNFKKRLKLSKKNYSSQATYKFCWRHWDDLKANNLLSRWKQAWPW